MYDALINLKVRARAGARETKMSMHTSHERQPHSGATPDVQSQGSQPGRADSLRQEIRAARERIISLVAQMDDIRLQQIPQIRADYALKIGCWEQELLQAELAARRARRRLALVQAQVNQGSRPQMDDIELELDEELARWTAKAQQAQAAYEQALSYLTGGRRMSRREDAQVRSLYHTLVKRLHPDVCGSSQGVVLFRIAQAAYANGDIQALQSLEVATRHLESARDDLDDVDDVAVLEQELELVQIQEGVMADRLEELRNCEDMRLDALLSDPDWVTRRTTELRRAVDEWNKVRDDCDERLRSLKEEIDER